MKPIRLFTIVWGAPYVDWFETACAKSLCWPRNREAARRIEAWDLWTTPEDAPRVSEIAGRVGVPLAIHADLSAKTLKQNMIGSLIRQMELCVARGAAFISASPDSIFGDGSLKSLMEIGAPPRVCVAISVLRVMDTILAEMETPLSNPVLVRLGFKHAHAIFRQAMVGKKTNTYTIGISWREISEGLYALQCRGYASLLITPEQKDIDWFRANPRFGYYDSLFPVTLIQDQRQRVVGSSDAVFVCELTPQSRPLPALHDADAEPDKFEGTLAHHVANRNMVCIWRAEGCN